MPGPTPGTGCTVCEHPDVASINADIGAQALSNRKIAAKYGLDRGAIGRHEYKRHPGVPDTGRAPGGVTPPDGSSQLDRLKLIRSQLEDDMAARARAETSRELRQVNARIAEIEGTDRPKTLSVADVAGLPEQVAAWFRALEPYPEARAAMMEATTPELRKASGVEP